MKTETISVYHTRTGLLAAEVKRHSLTTYSWGGKLGAASGSLDHVRQSLQSALRSAKGVKLMSGTSIL